MGKSINGIELGDGIYQRKDGRYCGRYRSSSGDRKTIYDSSLKRLRVRLNECLLRESDPSNMTVREWYMKWLNIYKCNIKESTTHRYKSVYTKMIDGYIGNQMINEIKNIDIQEIMNDLSKHYKKTTCNKALGLLRDLFDKAYINDVISKNPCLGIKRFEPERHKQKSLSRRDQADFIEYVKGKFYDSLFIIAINTGMRVGEICALTLDDIDMEHRTIDINKTLSYEKYDNDEKKNFKITTPKSKTAYRKIPMNEQCYEAMKKQLKRHDVVIAKNPTAEKWSNHLFLTENAGLYYDHLLNWTLNSIVNSINKNRMVYDEFPKITFHWIRHTFATRCFEAGINVKVVQAILGHANISITMDIYTHLFSEVKENGINELNKLQNLIQNEHDNEDGNSHQSGVKSSEYQIFVLDDGVKVA